MCALELLASSYVTEEAAVLISYSLWITLVLAIFCAKKREAPHADGRGHKKGSKASSRRSKVDKKKKLQALESKAVILQPMAAIPAEVISTTVPPVEPLNAKEKEGEFKTAKVEFPKEDVKGSATEPDRTKMGEKAKEEKTETERPEKTRTEKQDMLEKVEKPPEINVDTALKDLDALPLDIANTVPSKIQSLATQTTKPPDVLTSLKDAAPASDDGAYEDVNIIPEDLQPEPKPEAQKPPGGDGGDDLKTVCPEALRQATLVAADTKPTIDPTESLFPTTGGKKSHTLKNPRNVRLVFKIKCSNNNDYGIIPVYGFVDAEGNATVNVTRLPGPPKNDRMVIQFAETTATTGTPQEAFKLASPWSYVTITVPLKIVAELPPLPAAAAPAVAASKPVVAAPATKPPSTGAPIPKALPAAVPTSKAPAATKPTPAPVAPAAAATKQPPAAPKAPATTAPAAAATKPPLAAPKAPATAAPAAAAMKPPLAAPKAPATAAPAAAATKPPPAAPKAPAPATAIVPKPGAPSRPQATKPGTGGAPAIPVPMSLPTKPAAASSPDKPARSQPVHLPAIGAPLPGQPMTPPPPAFLPPYGAAGGPMPLCSVYVASEDDKKK